MNLKLSKMKLLKRAVYFPVLISIIWLQGCLGDEPNLPNLKELFEQSPEVEVFKNGLAKIGLLDQLDKVSLTVFAPSNSAMTALVSSLGYSKIEDVPEPALSNILFYHMVQGLAAAGEIGSDYYSTACIQSPDSNRVSLLIESGTGEIILNQTARVVRPDLSAINGYIHVIDKGLLPPDVIQSLRQNLNFSIFRDALGITGLEDSIEAGSIFTFFAPPNGVFENFYKKRKITKLSELRAGELDTIMRSHIIRGNNPLRSLDLNQTETLLPGNKLKVQTSGNVTVVNDTVSVLLSNVQATNGIFHFVNKIMTPR